MNSLFNKLRDSLNSLTGTTAPPRTRPSRPGRLGAYAATDAVTERFRDLLVELLRDLTSDRAVRMARRLRAASDLQALWFMRSEVMALLAPVHGEAEAMHRLEVVSATVREALPRGLRSRPSPLAGF
ncbi:MULTISPECIES: hypothetical protein [Ramlibacter]|uniref:DUF2019 domain-containing protein n=1 Tax=Ramlibacter aquaticus TaxID=2780094 RepID=A0ABR9SGN4_9BURK|nr:MULTISPECIES: hypothetical protein [Ramlibacter]MBE7941212.1 hypothetical protein [Ramlibacter aquaticus]